MSDPLERVVVSGHSYEAEVPDTFELADRARIGLEGMLNVIDPANLQMYGLSWLYQRDPKLSHWSADIPLDPKFGESLPMMRTMCGSSYRADLEREYRRDMLSRIDDGLYWDRVGEGRPYWRKVYGNSKELYGEAGDVDFCNVWGVARMIRALSAWAGIHGCDVEPWNRPMIAGLRRIAVDKEDYSYYPHKGGWNDGFVYARTGWLDTEEADGDRIGPEGSVTCFQGHQIYAAAQWFERSGDPVALELAERLSRYVMKPKFWGGTFGREGDGIGSIGMDGAFRDGSGHGQWAIHFHARAIPLRGLLYQAVNTGDERMLEFVRASYDFTMTQGIRRIGWVNTFPPGSGCESCALADLIAMAIRLTEAGAGDYWDDVDATVRNQLAEQQLHDLKALEEYCAVQDGPRLPSNERPGLVSEGGVLPRMIGTFVSNGNVTFSEKPVMMGCCTGNATQGLYYAWEAALREDIAGRSATVHLLFNRAGRLLDVDSHLPYEGKVILRIKEKCRISIRIPRWADIEAARVTLSGRPVPVERLGRYLTVRDAAPGEAYELSFPVRESETEYVVNRNTPVEASYRCVFRASTLVSVAGGPEIQKHMLPYYRGREKFRADRAPTRKVSRFVPDTVFKEW